MKFCTKCKKHKNSADFYKDSSTSDGLAAWCKDCRAHYANKYYAKNKNKVLKREAKRRKLYPDTVKSNKLNQTYGITLKERNEIARKQNYKCKICGKTEESGHYGILQVDHCHETKIVRGLLCHACNRGLGAFNDDIRSLKKAIVYLQKARK